MVISARTKVHFVLCVTSLRTTRTLFMDTRKLINGYRIHKPADFRLEDRKYYIDASGRRTRLVRCLKRGLRRGLFHDGGLRLWKADGTAKTADYNIIAVSSNQENKHD